MRVQIDQALKDCFSRCIDYMRVFWPVCRVGRKNLGNLVSFNHQRDLARWCARAVKDSSLAENQGAFRHSRSRLHNGAARVVAHRRLRIEEVSSMLPFLLTAAVA